MKSSPNYFKSYPSNDKIKTLEKAIKVNEVTSKIQIEKMALQDKVISEQQSKLNLLQVVCKENENLHKAIDEAHSIIQAKNKTIEEMKESINEQILLKQANNNNTITKEHELIKENELLKNKICELQSIIDNQIDVQSHLTKVHQMQDQIDLLQKQLNNDKHQSNDSLPNMSTNKNKDPNNSIGKILLMHENNTTNNNQSSTIEEEFNEAKQQLQNSYLLIMSYRDDIEKLIKQNQDKTNYILDLTQENNSLNEKIYKSDLSYKEHYKCNKSTDALIREINGKEKIIETLTLRGFAKTKEIEAIQCNHALQINELNREIREFKEREKALLDSLYHLKEYTDIVELTHTGSNIISSETTNADNTMPDSYTNCYKNESNAIIKKGNISHRSHSKDIDAILNNHNSNLNYNQNNCQAVIDNLKNVLIVLDKHTINNHNTNNNNHHHHQPHSFCFKEKTVI